MQLPPKPDGIESEVLEYLREENDVDGVVGNGRESVTAGEVVIGDEPDALRMGQVPDGGQIQRR